MYNDLLIPEERIRKIRAERNDVRNVFYKQALPLIGKDTLTEIVRCYELFDERIYLRFAELWDPESGGFYYSPSARDNDGFLPDIETTRQVLSFCISKRLIPEGKRLSDMMAPEVCDAIIRFTKSMQDPADGYFYHPQWGKNIIAERKSRDFGCAIGILRYFGEEPCYPTFSGSGESNTGLLPSHLSSIKEFKKFLTGLKINENSYFVGNRLDSECSEIKRAGREYVDILLSWLEEHQNYENGLWEKEITHNSMAGAMKMLYVYTALNKSYPNIKMASESAMRIVMSDEAVKCVSYINSPLRFIESVCSDKEHFSLSERNSIRDMIRDSGREFVSRNVKNLLVHRKRDGSYSYWWNSSAAVSQGAKVAIPDTDEGDVNATAMMCGVPLEICSILGIPRQPLFTPSDGELFFELLEQKYKQRKKSR